MLRLETPIEVSEIWDDELIRGFVRMFVDAGLEGTEGTLKSYPGSMHFHLRKPKERGTLELTWWPAKRRFWVSVHANRRAPWQEAVIEHLSTALGLEVPEEFR